MDGSVEVLVIICLVQRRGQNGMHFKTKLPIYPYYNTIRVLWLKITNQIIHWYQFSDLDDSSNIIKYL